MGALKKGEFEAIERLLALKHQRCPLRDRLREAIKNCNELQGIEDKK
jgi:hypothetical protein